MDYLKRSKCSLKNKTYREQLKVQGREGRTEESIEGGNPERNKGEGGREAGRQEDRKAGRQGIRGKEAETEGGINIHYINIKVLDR